MKKASNILIVIGLIIIAIICIFKFVNFSSVNFHFGNFPSIESKYLWWGFGAIVFILVCIAIGKLSGPKNPLKTQSNAEKWIWSLASNTFALGIFLALVAGIIYGGVKLKIGIDNALNSGGNIRNGKMVEVQPGRYTIVPISNPSGLHYSPPQMTVVEFLDRNQNPMPIRKNGKVSHSWVTGPGVDNDISAPQGSVAFVRFSSASNSGSSYTFSFEEN